MAHIDTSKKRKVVTKMRVQFWYPLNMNCRNIIGKQKKRIILRIAQ